MTVSKLTWHCQGIPGWLPEQVQKSGAHYVKVIDPPSETPFPGVRVIGRVYIPDAQANDMVMRGSEGAVEWFERCHASYQRAPWVWCWEGPNEPPVQTSAQRAALVAFTRRWVGMMHQQNRRTVALCLGVGWPDVGQAGELCDALQDTDYWSVHEYGAPHMQDQASWLCLRYQRTVTELRAAGSRIPPLLITECGIDGGVIGKPARGWKTFTDMRGYLAQLQWYDAELAKDDYVQAATIFTAGPNGDWQDFDVNQELSRILARHIAQSGAYDPDEGQPMSEPTATFVAFLIPPVAGPITQEFGVNGIDYAKFQLIGHNGRDYGVPVGAEVRAAHAGQTWAYDDPGGYGLTVEVWWPGLPDAGAPVFKTIYAHLSKQIVGTGDIVVAGQPVGLSGNTGNSTGPHLHFGFKPYRNGAKNPGYRDWIDPRPYLKVA